MDRGMFRQLAELPPYRNARKTWHVELISSHCFWYDLIVNQPEFADSKSGIVEYLNRLRTEVERDLEKRFIYFFTARPRVRFDLTRPPRYSLFGRRFVVTFLVGPDNVRLKREVPVFVHKGFGFRPQFELLSDSFIRFFIDDMTTPVMSVHDFIKLQGIHLGFASEVHYVGVTSDPGRRPIEEHRGIRDAIYRNPTSHYDFFIEVSTFNPLSSATSPDGGFQMIVANSMTDEIPVETEGKLIEAGLIGYFDAEAQQVDCKKAKGFLRNRLGEMARDNGIERIAFHLEARNPTEYDFLCSRTIAPSASHTFLWEIEDSQLKLTKFDDAGQLVAYTSSKQHA